MCFADFEFTCGGFIDRNKCEMLSVGIVICSPDYEIAEKYYSTARPNKFHRMTKQCRELTGLTQAEINDSPDSNDALGVALRLMDKYNVRQFYVWGNFDKPGLGGDIAQHRKVSKPCDSIRTVYDNIVDIQDDTVAKMGLPQAVSISELSAVFDYIPETGRFHNALNDAEALYAIHKAAYTTDLSKNERFCRLRQDRIDKLESIKAAVEERRREEAMSIPMQEEEQVYFATLGSKGSETELTNFIRIRQKFVRALNSHPDAEEMVMVVFKETGGIKIMPAVKFNGGIKNAASSYVFFKRERFGSVIVKFCKSI